MDIISLKNIVFLSLKIDFVLANSVNPDLQHFIWVFTVWRSTGSGVSSLNWVRLTGGVWSFAAYRVIQGCGNSKIFYLSRDK